MQDSPKIFPIAKTYPDFFNINLSDPNRVIKLLQGKNCSIRAFYYQLLKMVLQLEVRRNGEEVDYFEIVFNKIQEMVANLPNSPNSPSIKQQADKVLLFLRQLLAAQQIHFEVYLDKNRQIDNAFITVIQQMLRQGGVVNGSVQQNFGCLSQLFYQRVTQIQKCVKFQQSDVFVYIENQSELYLAFLKLDEELDSENNSIDKALDSKPKQEAIEEKNPKKNNKTQNDTIINIFGDMLHSSKNDGDSKVSSSFIANNVNNSLSPAKRQQETTSANNIYTTYNPPEPIAYAPQIMQQPLQEYAKSSESKFIKNQSKFSNYQIMPQAVTSVGFSGTSQNQELIYRPATSKNFTLKTISEVSASKQSIMQSQRKKKDPMDWGEQQQKGTFYRQFTDTRILNILPEPQRTTVKMLKNRFIGVHSRNFQTKI